MTHGLWTLRVKVDGETVVDTEAELGYITVVLRRLLRHEISLKSLLIVTVCAMLAQ
jgi:NADH:ubiquinone oxidoreductase subunit D